MERIKNILCYSPFFIPYLFIFSTKSWAETWTLFWAISVMALPYWLIWWLTDGFGLLPPNLRHLMREVYEYEEAENAREFVISQARFYDGTYKGFPKNLVDQMRKAHEARFHQQQALLREKKERVLNSLKSSGRRQRQTFFHATPNNQQQASHRLLKSKHTADVQSNAQEIYNRQRKNIANISHNIATRNQQNMSNAIQSSFARQRDITFNFHQKFK